MSRPPSRHVVAFAASMVLASCASRAVGGRPPADIADTLSGARAAHVLNRLAFGPRPGDIEHVMRVGPERWIELQLHPEAIADSAGMAALAGCTAWTAPVPTALALVSDRIDVAPMMSRPTRAPVAVAFVGVGMVLATRDSARRAGPVGLVYTENAQLLGCRLARVEASDQQLVEVMTDFWENHFSIFGNSFPSRGSAVEWDRAVIRPNALGSFRGLLGAVARSPAMLAYLDNVMSGADSSRTTLAEYLLAKASATAPVIGKRAEAGLNENFARELLELHTLGVDGGYSQLDVTEVARAFTGWTNSARVIRANGVIFRETPRNAPLVFVFDSAAHDADSKFVLGHALPAGRGMEDGEQVLDILARHPSTARFIARKLAVRFVSDAPPESLVERAAATFSRTGGDIREVVRTIVTSPEFLDPHVYRAKVKSPLELVLSIRRALGAPVDTAAQIVDLLIALEQPPFGKQTPEGWPETGEGWMSVGAMQARLDLAARVARGVITSIPVESSPLWRALVEKDFDEQMTGVVAHLLSGRVSTATRAALESLRPEASARDDRAAREASLRDLIALTLGSPEFQRR